MQTLPGSITMLKAPIRIAPQWKELKGQLIEKLELQKGLPEAAEAAHILLSDRPTIIFRASCFPSLMPLICFYSTDTTSYFASFTWRSTKGNKSQVRVWIYSTEDDAPVAEKDYIMEEDPQVLTIVYVPCRNLFVAYCDDIHFRLFSDHQQDVKLLSAVSSPYLITSVCYNPETNELVTGAIGVVAFWSFSGRDSCSLSVTHEVHLASGEFVHALSVELEGRALVALCENIIRVFDYQIKTEIRTFQVNQGVSLTCSSANWLQSFLYAGDLAGEVKVWNFDTGNQINQFKAHQSAISSIVSRISVHTLMTASLDGLLKEWNLTTCELLRRVDIGEPVFQMQFINEQTFFLRTQYTFSIRTLNNFYQLFNRTKSVLKKLVRVQCGPGHARILATTEDGVCRFLSPVTGEMLFVTWPFQFLEKALDYVYDPDREELLVTMGTSDIYVLDTSKNPCPTKYILRCTDSMEDKVLCLAYSRLDLGSHTFSFIFTGYKSGKVRSVTQHLYRMGGRKLHDGKVVALSSISASGNLSYHSRESSYLCSYGADEYIILSDVVLKRNSLLELVPLVVIPSANCRINKLLLIPGYICVLTDQNRVRLWRQAALIPGKKNPFWKESDVMHSTSITSFDYCYNLNMLVTGGADGSVRLWDILGQLLVEFDTSLKFSRVCFANQRGDLVVGGNKNIYFIPCVTYLPSKHLKVLATQCVQDDVVESPLPFLPCFLLSFNIVFVPKYRQIGKQAKKYEGLEPITNHREVVVEKSVAKVMEFSGKEVTVLPGPDFYGAAPPIKERHPEFAVEYLLIQEPPFKSAVEKKPTPAEPPLPRPHRGLPPLADGVPLLRRIPFQAGRVWPIAPDGYIPNSVIRAQLFPKGTPPALRCSLQPTRKALPVRRVVKIQLPEDDVTERREKSRKKKVSKMKRPSVYEGQHRRDLLAEIVSKPWLRHKPSEMTLPCVTKAILDLMDDVPYSTYLLCSTALVQIAEAYELSPEMQDVAFNRLIQDTDHKEVRMRLAAWEALGKMDLLTEKDVVPLARALLDDNKKVRDLARSLLDSVAGITDKFVLKKEMQRLAEMSLEDLTQLSTGPEGAFPRRVRAAGIMAETQDEAVYELTEGAQRLMNRVESLLTANLFLTTECPPTESRRTRLPATRRKHLASRASSDVGEETKPEAHGEAQARWLGLFGKDEKKPAKGSYVSEGGKPAKLVRGQQARGKVLADSRRSRSFLLESPSPSPPSIPSSPTPSSPGTSSPGTSSTSSTSSSGSTWEELRRARRALTAKARKQVPKTTVSQEAHKRAKLPKLAHPILLQRRDTRTQLYSEMLKHQNVRKEKLAAAPHGEAEKGESGPVQPKPSQLAPPVLPPLTPKGSLIDPKQQYSIDRTKWRNDLFKLLMLRISPAVEGRTAAEDFIASAQMALSGPTMSWELFTSISQSLLTSQEKSTHEPDEWRKYMDKLFKGPVREQESQVTIVTVQEGPQESPKSGGEATGGSMEDLAWELVETDEEARAAGKKLRPAAEGRKEEGVLSGKERKKMLKRKEKVLAREGKTVKEKEQEMPAGGEEDFLPEGKEWEVAKGKEREVARGREREVARGREREGARGREREVARGREREVAKGREREVARGREREVAKGREREAARGREREAAKGKEEEVTRQREQEAAARKSKEEAKRLARELVGLLGEAAEDGKKEGAKELDEWALAWERALMEAAERVVAQVIQEALIQVRKVRLTEAREKALAEVLEQAKEEAKAMSLIRVREMALAALKEKALAEVRSRALEEAQRAALAEAREKMLAEARQVVLDEVRGRALAEAQEQVLAEGMEGVQAVARVKELAEARTMELVEARALQMIQGMDVTADEGRVLELAAQGMELAEARAVELAEKRVMELAEERIWELVQPKIEELVKVRAKELTEVKFRELDMEEEQLRKDILEEKTKREILEEKAKREPLERGRASLLSPEEGAAALWEDTEEEGFAWAFPGEEREALLSLLEEEQAPGGELDFSARAQLLLDLLSGPEQLEASDSDIQQRLFQVVSLLQIPSTMDAEGLAETLLQKAQELLKEGEAKLQQDISERSASVLVGLRRAVEAHQPWDADPRVFASRMRALLKTALAVLRAKSLKERLKRKAREKAWWEKAEEEWQEGEDRIWSRRAWLDKKLRQTVASWPAEQDRAEQKTQELQERVQKLLRFRAQPVLLGMGEREGWQVAEERAKEEEEEKKGKARRRAQQPAQPRQPVVTWSLGSQREMAWKAIVHMEESLPSQGQRRTRLPRNSLYLTAKPPRRKLGHRLWSRTQHHIFRQDPKTVNWEMFTKLYQSLLALKKEEGGVESKQWQERSAQLLDLYGVSNPLVRTLMQRLLVGDYHQRKYVTSSLVKMDEAQASLGQRILYELVHHSARIPPKPPTLHGVTPLSYQNNVHPFKPRGTSRCGTMSLKWKTCFKRKLSKLHLYVAARGDSPKTFVL